MQKYPVISKNGNKYEVTIFFGKSLSKAGINVIIRKKARGLFGTEVMKEVARYTGLIFERETLEKYTWVELVKKYVARYEKEHADDISFEKRMAEIEKEFEEWDGYC